MFSPVQGKQLRIYNSIEELPVFNWWKVNETNDVSFLLIKRKRISDLEKDTLVKVFRKLLDEYMTRFGLTESFLTILDKKKEVALMIVDRWVKNDKSLQIFIDIAKIELSWLLDEFSGQQDFYEFKSRVETMLGFAIDIKKTTVIEFYSYVKMLKQYGGRKD